MNKTTTAVLSASLALAIGLSACGASGGDEATSASTAPEATVPATSDTSSTTAPSTPDADFGDQLPAKASYGYLDVELTSAKTTSTVDESWGTAGDEGDTYAVMGVTLSNPTTDATFTVDPRITHLELAGESYDPLATQATEVEPGDDAEATWVYPVPARADLSKAKVVVQELAGDPKDERIPAELGVDGTTTKPMSPVPVSVSKEEVTDESYCQTHGRVAIDKVVLTDRLGESTSGSTIGVTGAASNFEPGLGQARTGQRFLVVYLNDRFVQDGPELGNGGCLTEIGPGNTLLEVGGETLEPVLTDSEHPGVATWGQGERVGRTAVFLVPEDAKAFKVAFLDGDSGDQTIARVDAKVS